MFNTKEGGISAAQFINVFSMILAINSYCFPIQWGTRWRSWLSYCATSGKGAGSIPDGVTGIFH